MPYTPNYTPRCGDLVEVFGRIARVIAVDAVAVRVLTLPTPGQIWSPDYEVVIWGHGGCGLVSAAAHEGWIDRLSGSDVMTIMSLVSDPDRLVEVWNDIDLDERDVFDEVLVILAHDLGNVAVAQCENCCVIDWRESGVIDSCGDFVCQSCYEHSFFTCDRCEEIYHHDASNTVDTSSWCDNCRERYAHWCENCDAYSSDSHDHDESCQCDAPVRSFLFPANGDGTVRNDVRLTVALPAGTIPPEGLKAIYDVAYNDLGFMDGDLWEIIEALEPSWQTKRGNFTKRLGAALHKKGVKLSTDAVSDIGNVARQHSSGEAAWQVEFTRLLNGSSDEFANGDSCWWTSHSMSRCAFKNWGGLGLRSYREGANAWDPIGRAWVQPLNEELLPTHHTDQAYAYVVYNGYGDMNGYTPARIVAHLAGLTYCKVQLCIGSQYVNGNVGYLVAEQARCDEMVDQSLSFGGHDEHNQLDAHSVLTREMAAA